MLSNSHEFNQGALHALSEIKLIALALATHVGVMNGPKEAQEIKAALDGIVDPLITKYRKAEGQQ